MITIHRKEQWDILRGGIKRPWLVVGWRTPDTYRRLFRLWRGGIWITGPGTKRFCWVWRRRWN